MKEEFLAIWDKYQLFLWPGAAVLISIALVVLLIIPQAYRIIETNAKIEDTQRQIDSLNKKVELLKTINVTEYEDNLSKLNLALPSDVDITSLISQLQAIATSSNVQVNGFNIGLPTSDSDSGSFNISLEITGDATSVNDYINKIKNAPRIMTINKIEIVGLKNNVDSVSLDLQTYYQKQKTTIGSVDQSLSPLSDKDKKLLEKISSSVQTIQVVSDDNITGPKGKSDPFQ